MAVAAVVLAAGEASRYGSPKQRILLPRVLERLRETSVDEIVVVEGAYALEVPDDAQLVACPDWARGPGASLRCGLSRLGPEVAAAVVVLADGPTLAPQADRARPRGVAAAQAAWSLRPTKVGAAIRSSSAAPTGATSPTRDCATTRSGSSRATTSARRATSTRKRICGDSRPSRRARGARRACP